MLPPLRVLVAFAITVILTITASFTAAAQTGSITGRVTSGTTGNPLSDVHVEALRNSVAFAYAQSRADGAFTLSGLPAGTYTVQARGVGLQFRQVEGVVVQSGSSTNVNLVTALLPPLLDELVVTGTRGAETEKILDSPNSISVVPEPRIAERAASTVTDHLKAVPGMAISTGGIVQTNMVSRGFNNAFSGSLLMLQDYRFAGVPSLRVNVPFLFSGSNEDIDRIEVLQGPAAALYGPNSANGVLHVITKSPFASKGTTLTAMGGERELGRFSGRHAGVVMDGKLGYKLSGEVFTAKDFEYVDPNEPEQFPSNPSVPTSRQGQPIVRDFALRKQTGEARVDYKLSPHSDLITTAGYTRLGNAIEITTNFGAAQARNWSYSNIQQRFRHRQLFAQVFYNKSDAGNADALDTTGTFYLRSGIPIVDRSSILAAQLQQGTIAGRTKIVLGGEYIATRPQTAGTIHGRNEDNDAVNEAGAYVQTTTPLMRDLDFLAALRADHNTRLEGVQLSPRAALIYRPTANQNVRLTFNRAFNSPQPFSFFLDQFTGSTFPGMPIWIIGNPPKRGWTVDRSCAGDICMRSPYLGGGITPVSAAAAFPAFAASLPLIVPNLPVAYFGQHGEAGRQGIINLLNQVGPMIATFTPPTDDVVGSVLMNSQFVTPSQPTDHGPLEAEFANTLELGYKASITRLRLTADVWYQQRPASATRQLINSGVHLDGAALAGYLVSQFQPRFQALGLPPDQAAQQAQDAAGALAPLMAALPVGATALTDPLYADRYFVASYLPANGHVDVGGLDLAVDFDITDRWTLATTYSRLSENVFPNAPGSTAEEPLTANAPKHRATATFRFQNEIRGYSAEVRGRYTDAFPVISGTYNTFAANTLYEPVPVNMLVDINSSWRLPIARGPRLSVTATNILDRKVPTFVGVPNIGRLILTQLQYTF